MIGFEATRWTGGVVALFLGIVMAVFPGQGMGSEDTGTVTLTTGFDYSSGDYGLGDDTDVLYLPVTLKYASFPWTLKVTLPYLRVTGPASVVSVASGTSVTSSVAARRSRQQGLGDVIASATYGTDVTLLGSNYIDLTLKVKLPTANEDRGLGTGKADYSAQVDILRSYGPWTPFVTLGYRFIGESAGLELNDAVYASAGADYRLTDRLNIGAVYDYREPVSAGSDDGSELIPYLSWKLPSRASLSGYAVIGFSDGSPDTGVGVQLSYQLH